MSKSKETTQTDAQKMDVPKFNPDRPASEYDFGPDFIKLYVNEAFLGAICANIVRYENWEVPTAYVGYDPGNMSIVLGYNPEFMACLTKLQRQWVIKHEIYHICLQHILGRANTNRKTRQIFNIAADLAVNSLLGKDHMFEFALMPGLFPKNCKDQAAGKLIESFKEEESTEYYMEALRKFAKERQKGECPVCASEKKQKEQQKKQKGKGKKPEQQQQGNEGQQGKEGSPGEQGKQDDQGQNGQGNDEKHNHGDKGQGNQDGQGESSDGSGEHDHGHDHNHGEQGSGQGEGQLCDEHSNDEAEYTIGIGGNEGESMDGHPGWGELPEDIREIMNEKVKDMISEGVKRAQMKGSWGSVPASIQEIIQRLLISIVDWKSILRHFIGRARSMERDSTIKKINKKAPYIFPGVRRKTKAKLAFFIDQSGSMSDEDVQMAMAAAFDCSKEIEIDVYNFDTSVDEASHQVWKKGTTTEWHRTRAGGTDFDGVRDFVSKTENRGRWTGIAIVTDGYAPKMGQLLGTKIIWLITPTGTVENVREGDLVVQMIKEKTARVKR